MRLCQCAGRQHLHRRERQERGGGRGELLETDGRYSEQDSHHHGNSDGRELA